MNKLLPYSGVAIAILSSFIWIGTVSARVDQLREDNVSIQGALPAIKEDLAAVKTNVEWLKRVFEKYDVVVQK